MSDPTSRPWRETGEGVSLTVRLTPRGGRDALDGVETLADGRSVLKARVRAAPTEGEANAALILLLSGEFRLPRSQIAIVAGASARLKTVLLRGEPRALVSALEARIHGGREALARIAPQHRLDEARAFLFEKSHGKAC